MPAKKFIVVINGGSSSIKFAIYPVAQALLPAATGQIQGVGAAEATFSAQGADPADNFSRRVAARDHTTAAEILADWISNRMKADELAGAGHRIVHGGPNYHEPVRITPIILEELRRLQPFDPEHLPAEILLSEALRARFPGLPQVACFDTAFHHDLPRVARLLALPRRYEAQGVRRYGFHGLSYEYLMGELERIGGRAAASGRVVLAHLGSGASLAAVRDGKPIDTSMGFSPASGVPMSTRSGDLDPGLVQYLAQTEGMDPNRFNRMVNKESGLLGISEISSDMRELLRREVGDPRAAEAVAFFCYQISKWIGAFAAALEGIDTLVFAGGIGENAPVIRARICARLRFLGIDLVEARNVANAGTISGDSARVTVRVMRTNEELVIARSVCRILGLGVAKLRRMNRN